MTPAQERRTPSTVVWYELHTADAAAAEKFYSVALGWGSSDSGPRGQNYRMVTVGGVPIGGLLQQGADHFQTAAKTSWVG